MAKRIKNEQWPVKVLVSKIDNEEIKKPKYQRKKKWDVLQKKDSTPNEYSYIKFLYDTENSVHAITFGQESNSKGIIYSNIDGNNRINAIKHFIDKPFEIFDEYLSNLFKIFDDIDSENISEIKEIFNSLSYEQIIKMKTPAKFFRNINKYELFKDFLPKEEQIEDEVEKLQKKLMINESDHFDCNVKINVNLFEGYNTDELCKIFEDINKYNSKLTETELLSCRLCNVYGFKIKDKSFETKLKDFIEKYYSDKSQGEVLDCYNYNYEDKINAYDFIVGFQNLCCDNYSFIRKTDVDGLSLFFKLYKVLYQSFIDTFTSENVNDFIEKINYSCEILQETISNIFTNKINDKLFNKSCQDKLLTLKKNNLFMLISSIIGFKEKQEKKDITIKNLEKCLIYHFFTSDIKDKDIRLELKNDDSITCIAGGAFIENVTKNLLSNPETISDKLNSERFHELIEKLYSETNNPHERKSDNGKNKNDKRRKIKFWEKTLMFYYYKEKIPTNMLDNDFSIEHIIPNSSEWNDKLDKDRTGNLLPIISTINSSRGNKHITSYKITEEGEKFCRFIEDIIPYDEYNNIIKHDKRKSIIINNEKYNEMCEKNENIYKLNLTACLFK